MTEPRSFQHLIETIYLDRDRDRGVQGTLLWFVEEVGELVRAIRRGQRDNLEEEFGDVYAWLATLASLHDLDLEAVGRRKYGAGCPRCRAAPCACPHPDDPARAGPGTAPGRPPTDPRKSPGAGP